MFAWEPAIDELPESDNPAVKGERQWVKNSCECICTKRAALEERLLQMYRNCYERMYSRVWIMMKTRPEDCWFLLSRRLLGNLGKECVERNGLKAIEARKGMVDLSQVDVVTAEIWTSLQLLKEGMGIGPYCHKSM